MCSFWNFHVITVITMFYVDLVIGQTNNVISGTRFNITINFNSSQEILLWIRDGTLRDAQFNATTASGCSDPPLITASARFSFYCEDNGERYILELNSSAVDQGIQYTTDVIPSPKIQYAVIDENHKEAISYTTEPDTYELNDSMNIHCTVTCTPQDTSITVHLKQNDATQYPLGTITQERADCSAFGFQTITVTSIVTSQYVKSINITEPFTLLCMISYGGKSITRETSNITISSDTTLNSTNSTQPGTAAGTGTVVCDDSCIGGIVGGILAAVIVIIVCCWLYFRKKVPDPPRNFRCIKKTCDSVTLEWAAPSYHCLIPLHGYVIEFKDSQSIEWKEKNINAGVNLDDVKNLKPEETYYFRISAINKVGRSEPATLDTPVTLPPKGVPSKPEGPLEIKPVVSNKTGPTNSVTICWKPPKHDECSAVTGYIIEYRPDKKGQDWKEAKTVGAETCTCVVDKLTEGASYLFQVFAKNAKGRGEPLVSDGAVTIGGIPVAGTIETSLTNPPSGNNTDANNSGPQR